MPLQAANCHTSHQCQAKPYNEIQNVLGTFEVTWVHTHVHAHRHLPIGMSLEQEMCKISYTHCSTISFVKAVLFSWLILASRMTAKLLSALWLSHHYQEKYHQLYSARAEVGVPSVSDAHSAFFRFILRSARDLSGRGISWIQEQAETFLLSADLVSTALVSTGSSWSTSHVSAIPGLQPCSILCPSPSPWSHLKLCRAWGCWRVICHRAVVCG